VWLIAPDSYKGTLTAVEAAQAIADGVRTGWPGKRWECLPLGDGGEGTVDALTAAVGGRNMKARVRDPRGREVVARYSILPDGEALMEMAEASGLTLLSSEELDPFRCDTYGTGQLLMAASGVTDRITLGIGGSGTVDGGIGMGRALGFRFFDRQGQEVTGPGPKMREITSIDASRAVLRAGQVRVRVMCDVDNPLCGSSGAAHVFGPQKGASPEGVHLLDAGLARLGRALEKFSGRSICDVPGSGAAGGLGAALMGLLGAVLVPGAERALDLVCFDRHLDRGVELVLTGEGCLDAQSLGGKLPVAVARRSRKKGIPAAALPGTVDEGGFPGLGAEFAFILPASCGKADPRDRTRAVHFLNAAAERAARCIRLGDTLARERGC